MNDEERRPRDDAGADAADPAPANVSEPAVPVPGESVAADAPAPPPDGGEVPSEQAAPDSTTGERDSGAGSEATEAGAAGVSPRPPRKRPRDPAVARAYRVGIPVDGKVEKVIKGGYEIRVGKCRGFCPHSQMELHRVDNPEDHVGQTYAFRITQMRRGGEDLVLSRRAVLEESRAEEAKAVRATLIEGAEMQGRVARVSDFGAFVDLGAGVTGLVHLSELAHHHVARVTDAVSPGDRVTVKILKLDEKSGRISLSVRQTQDDPWKDVGESIRPGDVRRGTIQRLADFGAFVELAPGVEALAPGREFPPREGGWRTGLEPGTEASWLVLSVDAARRRISVVPAPEDGSTPRLGPPRVGEKVKGKVQRVEPFGVFTWLGPGHVGLVPSVWTSTPRGTDLSRRFPVGQEIEVEIVEVSDDGRRIRLSIDGAHRREADDGRRAVSDRRRERAGAPQDREGRGEPPPSESEGTFGTSLADALRAALGKREQD